MSDWRELQPDFRRAILTEVKGGRSLRDIAAEIPMDRVTVWRLMNGGVVKPSLPTVAAAERFTERVLQVQPPDIPPAED